MKYFRRKSAVVAQSSGLEVAPSADPKLTQANPAIPEVVQPGLEPHVNRDVSLEVPIDTSPQPDQPGLESSVSHIQRAPSFWEQRFTPDFRPYYINHATNEMSWHLPPGGQLDIYGALPAGWEIRCTAEGLRYFVNHNQRTTTFDDPRRPPHQLAVRGGPYVAGTYVDGYMKRTNQDGTVEFVDAEGKIFRPLGDPKTAKAAGKTGMRVLKLSD